jgi:aryl-alcohol dehydrogenase-like predicted oxidoreductase
MVTQVGRLLEDGKARAWSIVNWQAGQLGEAIQAAREQGVPQPCAAQLPYSLIQRDWVQSPEMMAALDSSGAGVVASSVMAGGVLTGKYDSGQTGRAAAELHSPRLAQARERGRALRALADETGSAPSALAIAFALANPAVVTVLFGATSPAQIAENVTALDVDSATVERLLAL